MQAQPDESFDATPNHQTTIRICARFLLVVQRARRRFVGEREGEGRETLRIGQSLTFDDATSSVTIMQKWLSDLKTTGMHAGYLRVVSFLSRRSERERVSEVKRAPSTFHTLSHPLQCRSSLRCGRCSSSLSSPCSSWIQV